MQCGDCFYNQLPWRANSLLLWDTLHLILQLCLSFLLSAYHYVHVSIPISASLYSFCHLCFPSLSLADGVIESKTLDGLTCADPAVFVSKFHRQPVYRGRQYETEDRGEQYRAAQWRTTVEQIKRDIDSYCRILFVCLFTLTLSAHNQLRSLYRKTSWHVLADATAAEMQNTCLKIYRSFLVVWDTERCVLFLPGGPSLFEYKAAYATQWLPQSLFHLHANYSHFFLAVWSSTCKTQK